MSFENFPLTEERAATDLDTQLAWLVREMGYSRDKTRGYEEKLIRLGRPPSDTQSVFGFMNNYWGRFYMSAKGLQEVEEVHKQLMATRTLQAQAKVVAGLCDKVAFSLWLERVSNDPEWLIDTALGIVRGRVNQLLAANSEDISDETLHGFNSEKSFAQNPMGQAILQLHKTYADNPEAPDTNKLCAIAVEGSAYGVLMWQAYARKLEAPGSGRLSSVMPQPGISSGNIEPWV